MTIYNEATITYDSVAVNYNGGTIHSVSPSDSTTFSDDLIKTIGASISDSTTMADALSKTIGISNADSISMSDAIAKAIGSGLTEASITFTDDLGKSVGLENVDTETLLDNIIAGLSLTTLLADTILKLDTYNDNYTYNALLPYNGTSGDVITLLSQFFRAFSDSLTINDTVSDVSFGKNISDTISFSDLITVSLGYSVRPDLYATIVLRPKLATTRLKPKIVTHNMKPTFGTFKAT